MNTNHNPHISAQIQQESQSAPISFARFMELALYMPEHGYYCNSAEKFGSRGDFVTAPEISPLFSHCVARQCQQVLKQLPNSSILELGAGRGVMAREILLYLKAQDCLPEKYYIIEISKSLRKIQRELIEKAGRDLITCVEWIDNANEASFDGIVIANELLDAMPVERFKVTEDGAKSLGVRSVSDGFHNEEFIHEDAEFKQITTQLINEYKLPQGFESEYNPHLSRLFRNLNRCLNKGVILFLDYGFPGAEYYHPQRATGTIMCHHQHKAHCDPLVNIGKQDITAHVDFSAVTDAAHSYDFELAGFVTQADFLMNSGLLEMIDANDEIEHYSQASKIKVLTMPQEMGELIKAIAFAKNFDDELSGFSGNDRSDRL